MASLTHDRMTTGRLAMGSGLIDLYPVADDSCNIDSGHEGVCAAIISHCDASPIFEAAKDIFYFVPLFVEYFIICDWYFAML
jgi:hypothetical protein